jgi:uncharacterized protein (DUF983 family)
MKNEFQTKVLFPGYNAKKSAERLYCPRCVKGNMYVESEDECVCLQCGYRHYTHLSRDKGIIKKDPMRPWNLRIPSGN